jgi:hypothetical protein
MKGILHKESYGWVVRYKPEYKYPRPWLEMKIYPNDLLYLLDSDDNTEVEFNIVDEFTHPELFTNVGWGDGRACAKLSTGAITQTLTDAGIEFIAHEEFKNVGDEGLFPNHTDKDIWVNGFLEGVKWYRNRLNEK